jgi:hypothetical protein
LAAIVSYRFARAATLWDRGKLKGRIAPAGMEHIGTARGRCRIENENAATMGTLI